MQACCIQIDNNVTQKVLLLRLYSANSISQALLRRLYFAGSTLQALLRRPAGPISQALLRRLYFAGSFWGAGMAQWLKRSPPSSVARVRWTRGVICRLSLLLLLVLLCACYFLRVLRFSSLLKIRYQHY